MCAIWTSMRCWVSLMNTSVYLLMLKVLITPNQWIPGWWKNPDCLRRRWKFLVLENLAYCHCAMRACRHLLNTSWVPQRIEWIMELSSAHVSAEPFNSQAWQDKCTFGRSPARFSLPAFGVTCQSVTVVKFRHTKCFSCAIGIRLKSGFMRLNGSNHTQKPVKTRLTEGLIVSDCSTVVWLNLNPKIQRTPRIVVTNYELHAVFVCLIDSKVLKMHGV